jgi:hypothetical protein
MNTAQTKLIAWSIAGALGVGLALYMVNFARHQDLTRQTIDKEEMKNVLASVKAPADAKDEGVVDYDSVKKGWVALTWVGRPKEAKVEEAPKAPEPGPDDKAALAKLVRVLAFYYDPSSEMETRCVLKYQAEARVDAAKTNKGAVAKRVGDKLEPPLQFARVVKIDERGVEFAFDDEARAHEVLRPVELDVSKGTARAGDGKAVLPPVQALPRGATYGQWPQQTVRIRENEYKVGTDDAKYIGENYDRILSEEVRLESHFDPTTHKRDGLMIKDLKPGSVVEQHGGKSGDVIKSINDHPVKSEQEALQFVKANVDNYDKWDVEVENHGETRIITIYPPKQ